MKQIWTGRVAQAAVKYGDQAPMATVCCNACRTCVQTNIIGLAMGGGLALIAATRRFAKRFV